ncbi:hypothetical protein K469DRAFT_591978 [Zopfia rhizophila CBS 207.26]|uniref:PCI domain-containing protein n=1 Tax=Zopfia rhizophila CBS 207.26 TaxID=1314779 RepID=A0A6A6DQH3_9PEZI|nr:hypothetical protein K469DRAFT_591978 [Zopfia rhizophila CBS 207.26]
MSIPTTIGWAHHSMPPHALAYNVVPARQSLARPMPPAAEQPVPAPKARKVQWSQPVRDYVQRAFAAENALEGIGQEEMQTKLKQVISYFAERDMLDTIDWERHPLPQHLIAEERQAAAMASTMNGYGWTNNAVPIHLSFPTGTTNTASSPPSSKKRKSMDDQLTEPAEEAIPPWRKANRNAFEDRITYSHGPNDKRHKKNDFNAGNGSSKFSQADLEKRKARFRTEMPGNQTTPPWASPRNDSDSENPTGPVIGTNQELLKNYLRLTAPPKPETVRPQHVLEKTLELLKKKWRYESNYNYICDQFKSLRQDLTVQHIKNAFTVSVYEIHARIALEKGDLGEYNQCQTQLRALYSQKLGGHPAEFLAYRILYYVYTCNQTDMNDLLAELTPADKSQQAVKHALDVRSALALGNYHRFFRLYLAAPYMGAYLMDMFIERERLAALANISRAYMTVQLRFITDELGFDSDADCFEFLRSHGAQYLVIHAEGEPARVNVKDAKNLFEQLRAAAFKTVDIKGQI